MRNNQLKILCVHQGYELYGSDRVFIQSIKAMRKEWPQSHITVHLPQDGPIIPEINEHVDRLVLGRLSVIRRQSFKIHNFYQLMKNIFFSHRLSRDMDVIYINTGVIFSYFISNLFTWKKSILHIHEIPTGFSKIYFYLMTLISRGMVIANSKATASAIKSTSVIYNGISDIGNTINATNQKLKILLIGRINGWKGHSLALEALSLLKQQGITDTELNFYGSYFSGQKHYFEKIKEDIVSLGLRSQVNISAFNPDPLDYYQSTDIVIVPSTKPEPFGLVAVEAMRSARPVIAANHGGLPEIVVDHETGLLFQPNNPHELAEKIKKYYLDRDLINKHGNSGRQRFLDHFQEQRYMDQFITAVKSHAA